jgi:hypothetical protein
VRGAGEVSAVVKANAATTTIAFVDMFGTPFQGSHGLSLWARENAQDYGPFSGAPTAAIYERFIRLIRTLIEPGNFAVSFFTLPSG